MREYEIKLTIKLDDEGYILERNWIYEAIEEQLSDDEEIVSFKIRPVLSEYTTPKFEPAKEEI